MNSRLEALRKLLGQGTLSTQDELREKLRKLDYEVTQSTISRDLRKLGAIKAIDPDGQTVYRLPEDAPMLVLSGAVKDLIIDMLHNDSVIVIHTTPGSASLVARHLDRFRPGGLLGTIAGDDTIFVAPPSSREVRACIRAIETSFELE